MKIKKRSRLKDVSLFVRLITWSFVIFISFMGILTVKISFWEGFQVPSSSMTPTFRIGDIVWVNKSAYGVTWPWQEHHVDKMPQRSEVIVFLHPSTREYYVKRVIGLPGDTVLVMGRKVWVNGELLEKYALSKKISPNDSRWPTGGSVYKATAGNASYNVMFSNPKNAWRFSGYWTVPPDNIFVLGDLRDESSDSREWGFVPREDLIGKASCLIDAGMVASSASVEGRTGCSIDKAGL